MLEERFIIETVADGSRFLLKRERSAPSAERLLLGKPTPCVGRNKEIALLEATVGECFDEIAARSFVMTAPTGAGKSRLLHEITRRLRDQRRAMQLIEGEDRDTFLAAAPYAPLLKQ